MSSPQIKLPGFGLDVNYEGPEDRFPNVIMDWEGTPLTVRERTMMSLMDQITDKPEWDRKVFDEGIVQRWRQEAKEADMDVSEKMLEWMILELRDNARSCQKDGMIPTLDLDTAVVKSDTAIPPELAEALRVACLQLEDVPSRLRDWHPGSNQKVLNLVHPSLFPLVHGRSRVLPTGRVALKDCVNYIGMGETTKIPEDRETDFASSYNINAYYNRHGRGKPKFWSKDYQWLPCQVAFLGNDGLEITSYINNLHPLEYPALYSVLEKCIAKVIPLWDRTLSSLNTKRLPRIGVTRTDYDYPQGHDVPDDYSHDANESEYGRRERWEAETRVIVHPEPGEYVPLEQSAHPQVDLRKQYKDIGLQIIVKLANIVLTPEKPDYNGGSWHVEGQLNEHICASALYYYDSSNITESFLAFRHRVEGQEGEIEYLAGQDDHEAVEEIYGIKEDEPKLQDLGRISTKQGRLLAFPNVLQHRVYPFHLQDPSKPGHRKILALFLVDPHVPILSTANVPPQQKEWWNKKIRQDGSLAILPKELADKVVDEVEGYPISMEEAQEIRLRLMEERKAFVDDVDFELQHLSFSFCEH